MSPAKTRTSAETWQNPLRDKRDKRLPRIAAAVRGGDLRRDRRPGPQKSGAGHLRPRQPRPAGARTSPWSDSADANGTTRTSPTRSCRRSRSIPEPRFGRRSGSGSRTGCRFVGGRFRRRRGVRAARRDAGQAGRGTGYRRKSRVLLAIPPKSFPTVCEQLAKAGLAEAAAGQLESSRHRETVRSRPPQRQ